MKTIFSIARRSATTLFAVLTLTIVFGAVTAQAQVKPFVDCTERVDDSHYRAYFGYVSLYSGSGIFPIDSPDNYFFPVPDPSGQPETFYPGVHHRVVAVTLSNETNEAWVLGDQFVISSAQTLLPCTDAGSNTHTITYQGRLTNGSAAANGQYDLRFQLYDAVSGGTSQSTTLDLENVQVTNGVFTVQLDFGVLPAILDGRNLFLEIGVRAGAATGSDPYTTLAPRQPLTATPYAIRAQSAANADLLNGTNADGFIRNETAGQDGNFNIYGNGTIGGDLTVSGTINGTATNAANANNAAQLGGVAASQYVQTNDTRLSDARQPTAGSTNYIQNTTTQQANSNFNVSGNGTIGGTLAANTVNASSVSDTILRGTSSSTVGARLALQNTTTGGVTWNIISTGSGNGEGAGKLVFFNESSNTAPLQINGGGANIIGNLTVSGSLSAATKNFKIDHPLDPANKVLNYTSVESPDMMNIYNGNVTTDKRGEAIVVMPDYFEALNKDFRYQLTVIGTFAQAIVAEEITGHQFKIKTDKPNVKVSWQVTGIRHDKFAEDNRPLVEEDKKDGAKNKCLYAPACTIKSPSMRQRGEQ